MIRSVLNIDLASARYHDFTDAHDHFDLWLFYEWNIPEDTSWGGGGKTDAVNAAKLKRF